MDSAYKAITDETNKWFAWGTILSSVTDLKDQIKKHQML